MGKKIEGLLLLAEDDKERSELSIILYCREQSNNICGNEEKLYGWNSSVIWEIKSVFRYVEFKMPWKHSRDNVKQTVELTYLDTQGKVLKCRYTFRYHQYLDFIDSHGKRQNHIRRECYKREVLADS